LIPASAASFPFLPVDSFTRACVQLLATTCWSSFSSIRLFAASVGLGSPTARYFFPCSLQAIARARVHCCSVLPVRGLRFPCEYRVPTSRTHRPTQGCVSFLFIAPSPAFVLGARWSDLVPSLFCLSVIFRSSARRITLVAGGFGSSVLRVHVCAHQVLDKMLELLCRFRL
jgi:hypothetical protein